MKSNVKRNVLHISIVVVSVCLIVGLMFFLLYSTGLWQQLNSVSKLQAAILSLGFWGRFAFVSLQFLQVTFIPIPSPILVCAGALIYGVFEASLLSLAGILLGSAVAFFMGRVFGKKLVIFMVGQSMCAKWQNFLKLMV